MKQYSTSSGVQLKPQAISDATYTYTLVANVCKNIQVPNGARVAKFGATSTFMVTNSANASTALVADTAGTQTVNVGGAVIGSTATGLANDATSYTASITVDSTPIAVAIVGSTAQTYTTLLTGINTALGSAATATISGGNVLVTSATSGYLSSVSIVDTSTHHLFASLTVFVAINAAVVGASQQNPTVSPLVAPFEMLIDSTVISIVSTGTPTVSVSFYGQ